MRNVIYYRDPTNCVNRIISNNYTYKINVIYFIKKKPQYHNSYINHTSVKIIRILHIFPISQTISSKGLA